MASNQQQHVVPRFYLDNFTDANGQLSAYEKNDERFFNPKPEAVAKEREAYSVCNEADNSLDQGLDKINNAVEDFCCKRIKHLDIHNPTNDYWQAVWLLCSNLILRSRNLRNSYQKPFEELKEVVNSHPPAVDSCVEAKAVPAELAGIIGGDDWSFDKSLDTIERAVKLGYPMTQLLISEVCLRLRDLTCDILYSEDAEFVTSDDPITVTEKAGSLLCMEELGIREVLERDGLIYFIPITPSVMVKWHSNASCNVIMISGERIEQINSNSFRSAYRQVYAPSRATLERIRNLCH